MIVERWTAKAEAEAEVPIYPDGCRDVIWTQVPGARPRWIYYDGIDPCPRRVRSAAGQVYVGLRLRPGARLNDPRFVAGLPDDPDDGFRQIDGVLRLDRDVGEILAALADPDALTVLEALGRAAVSRRTVERLIRRETGHGPAFWLRLARVRRAARAVQAGGALADVAAGCGYADQPHMTREMRTWFGMTPGQVRLGGPELILPGYAV